ncbi:class I SAM-dependent methyltransferase [Paenibacillus donghaensis]|uniref:class I SAM-dependent methyltransferase n=1 Tax=Paenibacillus donghaensis TaxID=414771 RepID=UPI0018841FC2|nr:class I SAM-dependent methyltransferase [Paenibacillus donghaensis]MBE9918093.1 class I SAM-dependent methyltransferase [Paenibacillus donghaensis]
MSLYGDDLFKGTASYYAQYRPAYPSSLIRFIVDFFRLDGKGRMVDLGCGTGQLAMRFSDWFEEIIGVDPEEEMLMLARRLADINRLTNMNWIHGRAEEKAAEQPSFRLVTIAKAFHWMDREAVLNAVYPRLEEGGGIVITDNDQQDKEPLVWQQRVDEIMKAYLGPQRRAGQGTYTPPKEKYEDTISKFPFRSVKKHTLPEYTHNWTIESILGNIYSTSYGARHFFGERIEQFEAEMRSALHEIHPEGIFAEQISVQTIVALK